MASVLVCPSAIASRALAILGNASARDRIRLVETLDWSLREQHFELVEFHLRELAYERVAHTKLKQLVAVAANVVEQADFQVEDVFCTVAKAALWPLVGLPPH